MNDKRKYSIILGISNIILLFISIFITLEFKIDKYIVILIVIIISSIF